MANDSSKPVGEIRLSAVTAEPVQVKHLATPPRHVAPEKAEAPRTLPPVKKGQARQLSNITSEVPFGRPLALVAAGVPAPTDELILVTNTELAEPGQQQVSSNVNEPSVAVSDEVILYTGNTYAARSTDGGRGFEYIDPFTAFPNPKNLGFCCDQVVVYIPSIDTFVWSLQYSATTGPDIDNIQRLAIAKTADVRAGRYRLYDITTNSLGVPGTAFDFPDLVAGANCLYATTNIYKANGDSAGAAVIRIAIDSIASGKVTAEPFVRTGYNCFRVAQNCGTRAFFATHMDTSTLNVFAWDEGQKTPVQHKVEVAQWIDTDGFQSRTPDGQSWLHRADTRITGATLAGTELYFAWGVQKGSNHRPEPFVQVARIDSGNMTLLENMNVFDPNSAICYPALATNAVGEVGISYMIGGGPLFPSHAVGLLTGNRKNLIVSFGDRGPVSPDGIGAWGDYLTARPIFKDQKIQTLFAATGYTMLGPGDGSNKDCTPRYVVFGRARDARGTH